MENRNDILKHLYGEVPDRAELGKILEQDEGLRREYQALSEIKYHLDQRPRSAPRPDVLDAIFAASAREHQDAPRRDRPARALSAPRRRLLAWSGAVTVLLAVLSLGIWSAERVGEDAPALARTGAPPPAAATEVAPPQTNPEVAPPPQTEIFVAEAVPEPAAVVSRPASVPEREVVRREQPQEELPLEALLTWDEAGDVREMDRRFEVLEVRSTNWAWEGEDLSSGIVPAGGILPDAQIRTLQDNF